MCLFQIRSAADQNCGKIECNLKVEWESDQNYGKIDKGIYRSIPIYSHIWEIWNGNLWEN